MWLDFNQFLVRYNNNAADDGNTATVIPSEREQTVENMRLLVSTIDQKART
jgi:hypothetical protein